MLKRRPTAQRYRQHSSVRSLARELGVNIRRISGEADPAAELVKPTSKAMVKEAAHDRFRKSATQPPRATCPATSRFQPLGNRRYRRDGHGPSLDGSQYGSLLDGHSPRDAVR
jgi:pyruvate/2-oxoglutarate dehydrogenase complex dihydrolipoamide acyltransferase (E2) component